MAFDPDAYLRGVRASDQPFDPDSYLKGIGFKAPEEKGFFENLTGISTEQFAEAAVPEFDLVKRGVAAAIQGVAGAPAGVEAGVRAPLRQAMGEGLLEQSELYQLGRRIFGREPTPEEIAETKARKIETDRTINDSLPLIPGLQDLAQGGQDVAEFIRARQSPEALEAVRGSQVQGNLLEAATTGDFSKLSFGENPSLYGFALQGADVLGSLFPVIIAGALGPAAAGAVGGSMAAGEASQNAKDYVKSKTDVELAAASPYYKDLIAAGVSPKQAREIIANRASEQAAFLQGSIATIGGVATQKIIFGAADKAINATGRKRLTRIATGGALAGTEEGAQEFLEGVASDLGINKEVIKEIGEDSFANFVLGFIGGAPVGMVRGAVTEPTAGAPPVVEPQVQPPVEPEVKPEQITPEDIELPPEVAAPEEVAALPEAPVAAAPVPTAPETFPKGVIGSYTNPLDETSAEIIATPDNRFAVRLIDLATGQSMDGGTFETADEANSMAASAIGMTVKPLTKAGAPTTPAQVTPTIPAAGTTPTAPAGETPPTLPAGVTTTIKPPEFSPEEQEALANYFQGQIPDAETIFQNRDRSGKGSIAQMQKIAAAPDYSLVGPSKVLAEGAPVIISDVQIPDRLRGRVDTATASNGQRFPVQYAVVPASELTASNMADGTVNPLYGDMNVPGLRAIAGNGRIAGIQEAYRRKTTEPYVAELMSDPSHGITPEQIASVPNPVLVRIIPKSLVPANIGDLSNVSGIAGLEPVDRAKNDLKRLAGKFDITGLQFTEEGNPQLSTLRQFIQAMPESEQSELINKSTGLPNPDASSRLMNAIFYGAYENDALIDLYAATTNPDAKMYLNSLARVAPKMVKLAGTGDYDIRNKVVEGIENLVSAVRQGVPIKEMPTFVKQGAIGLDPYAQKIMEFIADSGRSTKRIAEGLSRLADASMAASQISQEPDMFGQVPPRPNLDQVFESLKEIELEPDLDLFGTTPTETTPTDETKKPPPPPPPKEAPKETPGEVSMEIKKNAETIFKEIENLDIQGLAQWTIDNAPNEMLKEVARKSKQRIDDFAARNIQMDKVILSNARRRKGAKGSVRYTSSPAGFKFVLTLNGLVNGKEAPVNGLRYQTILHELVHATTMVQTMNYPKSNENIKALSSLRTLLRKRYREDVANKTLSADLVWKLKFAFQNIDELMAWGITDKDVQGYLKQVKVGPKFTAFGKLVEIARKILGLGPNSQTALESLLSTTDKLLSSPIQEVEKEIAPGRPPISRISPESPEKMVDEIREQQEDMFGKDAQTLSDLDQELPKAKKKLPPGRSPELTAMAELLRDGKITKQDFDAAVNKYRPIPLYAEPLEPATDQQVLKALSSDKTSKANVSIPTGTKVGLRLDIPAWNNHKTFVVSIHEGRPNVTSPKPGKAIGYRSVALAKNVTFGLGNQKKALETAAGEAKDALQTMEGEYVDINATDAFEMAKKAIKDERYVQIGFDPTRHAYFFDRKTTLPVIKADAVLQIGNMILARGVEYGKKETFLYNIDSTPELTEAEISQGITNVREEQIAEYARLRARRAKLIQDVIGGGASIEVQRELTNIDALSKELKEDIDASYVPSRSPEMFLKRALEAFDKGEMSAEVLATIQDAYNKTPFILNGLRLSIRTKKDEGSREIGNFKPIGRIVTLWTGTKGTESPGTIRHELTHSLEQMMTPEQRKVIVDAWRKAFIKAAEKNNDPQSRLYFKKVIQFLDIPSKESFAAATAAMPSFEFYQYISPSEYWAVNAETLMSARLGTSWNRFVKAVKKLLESLKNVFGFDNKNSIHKVFDQLMKDKPKAMGINALADYVMGTGARPVTLSNISQNIFGQPLPEASWGRPDDSKIDNIIYTLQDKQIDTKRVIESIKKSGKEIADKWNPYLQEELYHGRTATQTKDFLDKELAPLMKELRDRGLTMEVVEEYLHNRHAKARNEFNAKRDPNMPDGGSGILTADAQAYLDGLDPKQKRNLEAVAKLVDDIVNKTQEVIVSTGQESQETVDAWKKALTNYVPLQREETDYDIKNVGIGVGSGFAVKGPFSRAAVGSSRTVVDILANLAAQRERAIVRGEKMRVAKALYGLVLSNPNPGFWLAFDPEAIKNPQEALNDLMSLGLKNDNGDKFTAEDLKSYVSEPMVRDVDKATNQVVLKPNALLKSASTTFPVRINGKEKYIIFNANDPRAARMAGAMKNLDADQLSRALNYTQQITQYFAKINTQYNPIFGVINFTRDIQGAILQLSTTPLRYEKKKVLAGVPGALRGIYAEERRSRAGKPTSKDSYAELWREFQDEGGQTGFRDQFSRTQDRADALQAILDPSSWAKSPLGKVFTAGGTLKVPLETARKVAAPVFNWLSDYNQTMENAVRLSAYKVAKEKGMTKQQAASLAKNLTVNFNRKGQIGRQAGALYAFFNAAVQGTARMLETLRGPAGQKIIYGGLLLGSAQAMLLAALGFDEDEPPEFVKERNIVIPTGGSKYITIPMPLGYNVIPNTSRILTEWTLSGFKNTHKRVADITGAALDMFNPIGNAGWSIQTLAPTIVDPFVALSENKDWTGKPIAKEDISNLDPTPGYSRSKETASYISKAMAKFLNAATGGTDYTPGGVSPTPDQIDYLIGQLTGGVGRELLKAEQSVTSQFTGEELPIYKVPLVGRFIGDSEGQAAERNRFYNNIILLNKHEREIKGRQKDRIPARDYLMEYPEARLYSYANQVERNIRTLRKRRDALIEQDAPKERVKQVENQMTVQMKRFNERVKNAQE